MLERARQRREALKSRLKEVSVVTGQKRNVKTASSNENIDCEPDDVDEGIHNVHTAENKIELQEKIIMLAGKAFRIKKQPISAELFQGFSFIFAVGFQITGIPYVWLSTVGILCDQFLQCLKGCTTGVLFPFW